MKCLIVEDDEVSSLFLKEILKDFAECYFTKEGLVAIELFRSAILNGEPFELICLDIMLPNITGQGVLKQIRKIEEELEIYDGCKVIMTSALDSPDTILESFKYQADGYLVKPIIAEKILEIIEEFDLT